MMLRGRKKIKNGAREKVLIIVRKKTKQENKKRK
jgi:hypothetical protein